MLLIAHCSLLIALSKKKFCVLSSEFRVLRSEFRVRVRVRVRVICLCQKKDATGVTSLTISVDKDLWSCSLVDLLSLLHLRKMLIECDDSLDSFEEVVYSVVFVR